MILDGCCKVYFIRDMIGNIKIGIANNVRTRLKSLQISNPNKLYVFRVFQFDSRKAAREAERVLHTKFTSERQTGEWFKEDKILEWLNNDKVEVAGRVFKGVIL